MDKTTEAAPPILLHCGEYRPAQRAVARPDGTEVRLTPNEARLLEFFGAHPDEVLLIPRLLREVWGWKTESRTVYTTVFRLREKIERDPRQPEHLLAVAGSGYRFVPRTPSGPLRVDGRTLWGRTRELAEIRQHLSEGKVVVLVGPGGIGKSALARAALDGTPGHFCAAAEASDTASLIAAIYRSLGLTGGGTDPLANLLAVLREQGAQLLVLDNVEQVLAGAREVVAALSAVPGLRLLLTSRIPLQAGEVVLRLGALPVPQDADSETAAVSLFLEQARLARPSLPDTPETHALAARIARRVEGVPLCLHLAAARVRTLSLGDLLERLEQRLLPLLSNITPEDHQHQTILGTLSWSWALLEAEEQEAGICLSVFRAPFTLAAAEAVLGGLPGVSLGVDVIGTLVEQSLLLMLPAAQEGTPARYQWLESIREFVALCGEPPSAVRQRHARHFSAHGRPENLREMLRISGHAARHALLLERADIQAGFLWSLRQQGAAEALELLTHALGHIGRLQGPPDAVIQLLERLLERGGLPPALEVQALTLQVELGYAGGRPGVGMEALEAALLRHSGQLTPRQRFTAEKRRSLILAFRGRRAELRALLDELVEQLGPLAGPTSLADACVHRGVIRLQWGEVDGAEADLLEGLRLSRELTLDRLTSCCLGNLAVLFRERGALEKATACAAEALAIARDNADHDRVPIELTTLATLDYLEGRFGAARDRLEEARQRLVQMGMLARMTHVEGNRALVRMALGENEAAIHLLRRLCSLSTTARAAEAMARAYLGELLVGLGRTVEGRVELELALGLARQVGSRWVEAMALEQLALLHEDKAEGAALAQQAVAAVESFGTAAVAQKARAILAEALAAAGQSEAAATQIAALRPQLSALARLSRLQILLPLVRALHHLQHPDSRTLLQEAAAVAAELELGPASVEATMLSRLQAAAG